MRIIKLFIALFIALLFIWTPKLRAQISLEQYCNEVLNFSLELKLYEERIASAESSQKLARTRLLPSLSVAGNFSQLTHSIFAGAKNWTFNLYPQIAQTVYAGGSLRAAVRRADIEREVEVCNSEFTHLEVEYAAEYAYWNLSAMKEYREVAAHYYTLISSLEAIIRLRYEEGYVPKSDLLMMQTRMGEALYGKIASEQSYAVALQNFNTLRGHMDVNEEVELSSKSELTRTPLRSSMDEVLSHRPDYQASLLSERYAEEGLQVAKSSYNPTLSVGVRGLWEPYFPNFTGATYVAGLLYVDISIPIFNFGARRKALDVAKRTHAQSQLSTQILDLDIARAEANAWTTLSNHYAQMNFAAQSLSIASENLEISTYSYEEGVVTIVEVMAAQVSWLQLYTNSIASELAYVVAVADYKRVTASER